MSIKRTFRKLEAELLREILQVYRSGGSSADVREVIRITLKSYDLKGKLDRELKAELQQRVQRTHDEALKRYEYIVKFTAKPEDSAAGIAITRHAETSFAQTEKGINKDVVSAVVGAFKSGLSHKDIQGILHQRMRKNESQAQTIANTATAAFQTAASMQTEASAGVTKWKYSGPPGDRPFCQHHLGRVYSMRDIRALNNGQGLDAYLYRGGWNCRHMWVAQPVAKAKDMRAAQRRARGEYERVAGSIGGGFASFVSGNPTSKQRKEMQKLSQEGMERFEVAGKGFFSTHASWFASYDKGSKNERSTMDSELDAVRIATKAGLDGLALRSDVTNHRAGKSGSAKDALADGTLDGRPLEITTSAGETNWPRNVFNKLKRNQSDVFLVRITGKASETMAQQFAVRIESLANSNLEVYLLTGDKTITRVR